MCLLNKYLGMGEGGGHYNCMNLFEGIVVGKFKCGKMGSPKEGIFFEMEK